MWPSSLKMWADFIVPKHDQSSEPPGGTSKMKSHTQVLGLRIPWPRAQKLYHQKAPYDSNDEPTLGTAGLQHAESVKNQCVLQCCCLGLFETLKMWLLPDRRLVNSTMLCVLPYTLSFTFLRIFPLFCTMEIRKHMQVQCVVRKRLQLKQQPS